MGFVFVQTGGTPHRIGRDTGRAARRIIRAVAAENDVFFRRHASRDRAALIRFATKNFLPSIVERTPAYLEELRGTAEGAGCDLADLLLISAEEELLTLFPKKRPEKCSSAFVRRREGGVWFLHNEDYGVRYRGRLVVVAARPSRAPAFLSLGYPGTLAGSSCGFNEAGVAFGGNSLSFGAAKTGLPKNFVLRRLLAAESFADVERMVRTMPAIVGHAVTIFSSREGRGGAVEYARGPVRRVAAGGDVFVHTNHVLDERLHSAREKASQNTRRRHAALTRSLSVAAAADLAVCRRALSDPSGGVLSVPKPGRTDMTLASVIIDPQRKVMHIAARGAGSERFRRYGL